MLKKVTFLLFCVLLCSCGAKHKIKYKKVAKIDPIKNEYSFEYPKGKKINLLIANKSNMLLSEFSGNLVVYKDHGNKTSSAFIGRLPAHGTFNGDYSAYALLLGLDTYSGFTVGKKYKLKINFADKVFPSSELWLSWEY